MQGMNASDSVSCSFCSMLHNMAKHYKNKVLGVLTQATWGAEARHPANANSREWGKVVGLGLESNPI